MSEPDHIGQGHPDEPFVGLIRGISQEVHDHELRLAESAAFDRGWLAGVAYLESETKERVRNAKRSTEARVHHDYSTAGRTALRQDLLVVLMLAVLVGTLAYISKGAI